jgi:thiamine biosynthesis lipoprotein
MMSVPGTPRLFRFNHEAMRTEWNFLLVHTEAAEAAAAAGAAFHEVDAIESELSRFRPSSDIARLGRLKASDELGLGLAAWDCLSLAKDVWMATNGAFDAALGPLYELWHQRTAAHPPTADELAAARARSGSHLFELDPDGLRARVLAEGMKFDLGAIGKGYALDIAADLLRTDWDVENALLVTGGGSTILPLGSAPNGGPWFVNAGPVGTASIPLAGRAVSASGFTFQGAHIINPRTGFPISLEKSRAWAFAPTAALSDALSTAFLVMDRPEIEAFCQKNPEVEFMLPPA